MKLLTLIFSSFILQSLAFPASSPSSQAGEALYFTSEAPTGENIFEPSDDVSTNAGPDDFRWRILNSHNNYRAKHGAGYLMWDDGLMWTARNYANQCRWGHSGTPGLGENLAATGPVSANMPNNQYDPTSSVKMWYDEWPRYNGGGFSSEAGHFTQLVWKRTTHIGCAMPVCGNMRDKNSGGPLLGGRDVAYLVCMYHPPGNYEGQYQQNVERNPRW